MPVAVPLTDLCESRLSFTFDTFAPDGILLDRVSPLSEIDAVSAKTYWTNDLHINFALVQQGNSLILSVFPSTPLSTQPTAVNGTNHDRKRVPLAPTNPGTVEVGQDLPHQGLEYCFSEALEQAFGTSINQISAMNIQSQAQNHTDDMAEWLANSMSLNADGIQHDDYSSIPFQNRLTPSFSCNTNNYQSLSTISQQDAFQPLMMEPITTGPSPTPAEERSSPVTSSSSSPLPFLSDKLVLFDLSSFYNCSSPESSSGSAAPSSASPSPSSSATNGNFSSFPTTGAKSGVNTTKSAPRQARRRRFQCLNPDCPRLFTSEYTRRVHMATHNTLPRKALPCTMREETGCTEMFSRAHDRLRHEVAMHGKECEWVCSACGRFFSTARMLEIHKCPGTISGWIKARCPRIAGELPQ